MIGYGPRAWRAAMMVGGIAVVLAFGADRWYVASMRGHERDRVRARVLPYANALRAAIDRRIGLLLGFHSFVSSRRTRADLEQEFAVYARGAQASTSGVRALEYIDGGRIARIEPLTGSENALGLDLAHDVRPDVRADLQSALAHEGPFVSGPFPLAEGGMGILLRQRLAERAGFPQIVAVVLDAPSLVKEAGIPDRKSGLRIAVANDDGSWMAGDGFESLEEPVEVEVTFEGESWTVRGMPIDGWTGAVRDWHWSFHATMVLLVLLAGIIAFTVGDRLDRLTREMEQSGSALEVAMRAGGTGAWSLDAEHGRMHVFGATPALLGVGAKPPTEWFVHLFDGMPPEDRARTQRVFDEVRAGKREAFATEFRFVRESGGVRQLLCLGQLTRDSAGAPRSLVGILTDVTARRAMEERLQQAERMDSVGKLAGGVAHDFNNLLTAITGFAELAAGHVSGMPGGAAADIATDVAQVLQSTEEGARLTTQLLAFSRRAPSDVGRVDLASSVANLRPILTRLFAGRLDVAVELPDALPAVRAEVGLLTQVVLTLLVRARDTVPGPERVRLRAYYVPATSGRRPLDAPLGEWVCLEIVEEGQRRSLPTMKPRRPTPSGGIGPEGLGDVAGLGLAVIASGIESAGGRMVLEVGEHEATTTRVFLPIWTDAG